MNTEEFGAMNVETVKNTYTRDKDINIEFTLNGNKYTVKKVSFGLCIMENGEEYRMFNVDSYYDCIAYSNGILFWGDRLGNIHTADVAQKCRKHCFYISDEAEKVFNEYVSLYPDTLPYVVSKHRSGDYTYLPETNVINRVVSELSITTLCATDRYLIAGDISGRTSVFDIADNMRCVKTVRLGGAVSRLSVDNENIIAEYVVGNFDSPYDLCRYDEACKTVIDIGR